MKVLIIAEYREGNLLDNYRELLGFTSLINAECIMFGVGSSSSSPDFSGKMYLADVAEHGEFQPAVHRDLIIEVARQEDVDMVIFSHTSYGWDIAPRVANGLDFTQVSEVVDIEDGVPVAPVCNGKLRRKVASLNSKYVLTLQPGAFQQSEPSGSTPEIIQTASSMASDYTFLGYEEAPQGGVDLGKAEIIVSAGRGIGKADNIGMIEGLAKRLGGEFGASRPVVDAQWVDHNRQVGTTGQSVSPKLYIACGISGAIQHIAGMKKSEFIVAINTDRDAPIGEIADVLVVSDVNQFVPAFMENL